MSRGRKARLTEEKYIKAVRRTKSTKDSVIGKHLSMDRSTIYYFRRNNPLVYEKGQKIIAEIKSMRFDAQYVSKDVFCNMPTIKNWEELQMAKKVKPDTVRDRISALYRVCKELKVHPDNLNMEIASQLVIKMRDMPKEERRKDYYGLSYYNIRKPLRSFFQLVRGISGELLSTIGIDASRSEGTGKSAREKVTKEQRARFEDTLRIVINEFKDKLRAKNIDEEIMFREVLGISHWMYYTATRIGVSNPTEAGSISIMANNVKHIFGNEVYKINVMDKGKRNKYIEWNKLLIDDGRDKFIEYITERFDIQRNNVAYEMRQLDTPLFPTIQKYHTLETAIMKSTHRKLGNMTKSPNHIWRHTFAQDFLHASDWNYELCASIGGWKDTGTLKLSYGEMSEDAQERGLRSAMKLPVEDVTYKLMW